MFKFGKVFLSYFALRAKDCFSDSIKDFKVSFFSNIDRNGVSS